MSLARDLSPRPLCSQRLTPWFLASQVTHQRCMFQAHTPICCVHLHDPGRPCALMFCSTQPTRGCRSTCSVGLPRIPWLRRSTRIGCEPVEKSMATYTNPRRVFRAKTLPSQGLSILGSCRGFPIGSTYMLIVASSPKAPTTCDSSMIQSKESNDAAESARLCVPEISVFSFSRLPSLPSQLPTRATHLMDPTFQLKARFPFSVG